MELGLDLDTRGMQSGDSPPPGGWPAHPYDVELLNCVQQLPKLQRLDLGWGGQFDYNDTNCLFDYCLSIFSPSSRFGITHARYFMGVKIFSMASSIAVVTTFAIGTRH